MKILYHHRTASRDGQAVHIDEMIHALRMQGHEVMVVSPEPEARSAGMGAKMGWVHRLRASLPKSIYEILEFGYSWVAYRRLREAVKRFQPDVIYERYNLFMIAGVMLARQTGLPYLVEVNAPLAHERAEFGGLGLPALARWTERYVWQGADRVFAVTSVLGRMIQAAGVEPARIVITPNGINPDHFAQAPDIASAKAAIGWSDAFVLGFTGFVRDWHGVDRVVRWLARPSTPSAARLLVVGDGPARVSLERLAAELKVEERVRFTGVVDRAHVPALVAAFDVALQPAVVPYASPLKLFEYLALGKAVVAPMQPNILEILQHRRNALLFDENQPEALEGQLNQLIADAELRHAIGHQARATISERRLTWGHNAQVVADCAAGLLQHRAGVARVSV